jgi:hypothetical protein
MITLHIEAANLQDLRTKVAQALGDVLIPEAMYVADTKPAPVAKAAKPRITEIGYAPITSILPAATVTLNPTSAPTPASTPVLDTVVDTPATDGALDYDADVKPAVLAVSKALGRTGVEDLLKPFNVTNAKFIPADQFAALVAAAKAMVAA